MTELSPENMSFKDPLTRSPSYIPADRDTEFLQRDEVRFVRIGLELLKTELIQREQEMRSTIVVFGSARLQDPAAPRETLQLAEVAAAPRPNDSSCRQQAALARRQHNFPAYYDVAREFSCSVSSSGQVDGRCDYVIVTGGGSGTMEAAYREAADAHAKSFGLNITFLHKQHPNSYITPELSFPFRYFAIGKMHFMIRSKALSAFPGGFGTLAELFDTLPLLQTGTTANVMVLLVGRDFWERLINWQFLVENGLVSQSDL
jgi:predicted Rossmann-fold nucleotide-binding protein